jgi:hypothetical protein
VGHRRLLPHFFQWINTLQVHLFIDSCGFVITTSKIYDPDIPCLDLLINLIVTTSKFWDLSVIFYFFNFYVSGTVVFVRTEVIVRQYVVYKFCTNSSLLAGKTQHGKSWQISMIWPELEPADSEFRRTKPAGIRKLSTTVLAPFNFHSFTHPSNKTFGYNWSVFRSIQYQHNKKVCSNVTLHIKICYNM